MLVLTRHINERVFVGDNIVVTLLDIRGDKVRLGFDVPEEIPVHREEVRIAIQKQREEGLPDDHTEQ